MSSQAPQIERHDGRTRIEDVLDHSRFADRWIARVVRSLKVGHLIIETPSGARVEGRGPVEGPRATLILHKWRTMRRLMFGGDVGFAEAYMDGDWSTPDLATLIELAALNEKALSEVTAGRWFKRFLHRVKHLLRANTKSGSRRNIEAHYDLGNDFYKLWLDPSMTYSSALYATPKQSLEDAQDNKLARIMDLLTLNGGERVLEIGCGWGRLAERISTERNAHVTGLTLSPSQLAVAKERIAKAGASDKADLRLQDYRDISDAPFDAICSIEMVEAVGQAYWPQYFSTVARLLKEGGKACVQSIVIRDDLFERYVGSTDFIQQYIFPGGCLPSPAEFRKQAQAAGLRVVDEVAFGGDYGHTLHLWRKAFHARRDEVLALGFDARFMRIWDFYLAYCEAAFTTGDIELMQFTLQK